MLKRNSELRSLKEHISYSQFALWKRNPELYKRIYFYGDSQYESEELLFGRKMAEGLENGSDDIEVETARLWLPDYPKREYELEAEIGGLKLKAKFDLFDPRKKGIGEVKTGKKWTQGMVDNNEQLKFYDLVFWANYKELAKLNLYWLPTKKENGVVSLAGPVKTFGAKHTLSDLLLFFGEIKKVRKEIIKAYKQLT